MSGLRWTTFYGTAKKKRRRDKYPKYIWDKGKDGMKQLIEYVKLVSTKE
jgi:hypothetical protein